MNNGTMFEKNLFAAIRSASTPSFNKSHDFWTLMFNLNMHVTSHISSSEIHQLVINIYNKTYVLSLELLLKLEDFPVFSLPTGCSYNSYTVS